MVKIALSNPTRTGYKFLGWTPDPDRDPTGTLYQPGQQFEVTDGVIGIGSDGKEGIQLYDVWAEIKE